MLPYTADPRPSQRPACLMHSRDYVGLQVCTWKTMLGFQLGLVLLASHILMKITTWPTEILELKCR